MSIFKCGICGGSLLPTKDPLIYQCEYCGTAQTAPSSTIDEPPAKSPEDSLALSRAAMALEDGDYSSAFDYFDKALDTNPYEAVAYLGKFLAERKVSSLFSLRGSIESFQMDKNFQRAFQYATPEQQLVLQQAIEMNEQSIEADRVRREKELARKEAEQKYRDACGRVEAEIMQELQMRAEAIRGQFEPPLAAIKKTMGVEQSQATEKRVSLQKDISQLKKQRTQLGLFKARERIDLEKRLKELEEAIAMVPSMEQINQQYAPQIDEILAQQNREIEKAEAAIRMQKKKPNLEDFIEGNE